MARLSLCMDAPVVFKADGELIGYIKNVYFDKISKNVVYFRVLSPSGEALLLRPADVSPRDAVIVEDKAALLDEGSAELSAYCDKLLGTPAYTLNGTLKGTVCDAYFSKSGKLTRLIFENGEAPAAAIACFGDVILLKACKQSAPRIPRPTKDYPVHILSDEPLQNDAPEIAEEYDSSAFENQKLSASDIALPAISLGEGPMFSQGALNAVLGEDVRLPDGPADAHTPTRIICDYDFLLGRKLSADLKTYLGDTLAPKGSEISPTLVELARAHGKLVELALLSGNRGTEA